MKKIFQSLLNIFQRKPDTHPILGHKTKFAFSCGGKDYYQFEELSKMPSRRWAEFLLKFEEMRMGVTREWIRDYLIPQTREILNVKDKLDIGKLSQLIWELDARTCLVAQEEMVYAVCSVTFFELNEDVIHFDFVANKDKVDFWKSHSEPADFFFQKPISDLIGSTMTSKEDILDFLQNQKIQLALIRSYSRNTWPKDSKK